MSTPNTPPDGGPAFPQPFAEQGNPWEAGLGGMTLRDWFAGQALKGLLCRLTEDMCASMDASGQLGKVPDAIVNASWIYADLMLKRRAQ